MKTIIFFILVSTACGGLMRKSNYYSINPDGSRSQKYSRVNEYSAYGTQGLGAQQTISDAYEKAQHAPPPQRDVKIFNSSLPAGVKLADGVIQVDKDADFDAVGRFEIGYWLDSAPNETDVKDDITRLAQVTDTDAVVVEVQHVTHGDPRVNYLVGFVMRHKLQMLSDRPAPTAAVVKKHVKAKLEYVTTARGCMSRGEFADEVSARLGYSPWVKDAELELSANIVEQAGSFKATIRSPKSEPKQLTGATCRNVTDAAIAVLVVRLDE
jgi:hypothetical protein